MNTSTTTLNVSPVDLVSIFQHHEKGGARPARLAVSRPVKLLKKSRIDGSAPAFSPEIFKVTENNVMVNFDYEGNVNRQREREGKETDFTSEENWFEHESKTIVRHKKTNEQYAFVRVLSAGTPCFVVGGKVTNREMLAPWLPASDLTDSERMAFGMDVPISAPKQELEKEIMPITVKLANIVEMTIDNTQYNVIL